MKIQRVSSTVTVNNKMRFKGTASPLRNISIVSEDTEISKELAQASKNNFVTQTNAIETPTVGRKITVDKIPNDLYWNSGSEECFVFCEEEKLTSPHIGAIEAFTKDNIGRCIKVNSLSHICHSYPQSVDKRTIGAAYMENNGSMTLYRTKDLELKMYEKIYSPTDIVILGLLKDNRKEVISFLENYDTSSPDVKKIQLDYLISLGREDEALERFPREADYINNKVNSIKHSFSEYENIEKPITLNDYFAKGDFRGAIRDKNITLPEPFSSLPEGALLEIADYIENNNLLEEFEHNQKINNFKYSDGCMSGEDTIIRMLYAFMTMGITEAINLIGKLWDTMESNINTNSQIRDKRKLVCFALLQMLKAQNEVVPETKDFAKTALDVQASKEPAKELLQQRLIQSIRDYKSNQNIDVPNCVMITGNNPYVAKDLEKWVEEQCGENVNCVKLSSKKDSVQMQEDILNALETAEENYEETNKRSVIFVNGMEKLLHNDINDSDDIAKMKNYMDKASRYFHSTIVFYAKEPNKLDPGTVGSHKIGLKINLPDCGKAELLEWRNV